MNFKAIQDAVMNDRFDESQRGDIKNWINHRYGWVWALENWTFKKRILSSLSVSAGSQLLGGLPSDLGVILAISRADGQTLRYLPPRDFAEQYYGNTSQSPPMHYTVIAGVVFVGPTSSETSSAYQLIDEPRITLLAGDNDVPTLPQEFHFALVHGGAAEGLKLQNDFTWQFFEQDFQASITAMRQEYLADQRGDFMQYGADDIDGANNDYAW